MGKKNPYARYNYENENSPFVNGGYLVDEPEPEDTLPQLSSQTNPFLNTSRARKNSEETPVPKEPSAKALGKLRRMSGLPGNVLILDSLGACLANVKIY